MALTEARTRRADRSRAARLRERVARARSRGGGGEPCAQVALRQRGASVSRARGARGRTRAPLDRPTTAEGTRGGSRRRARGVAEAKGGRWREFAAADRAVAPPAAATHRGRVARARRRPRRRARGEAPRQGAAARDELPRVAAMHAPPPAAQLRPDGDREPMARDDERRRARDERRRRAAGTRRRAVAQVLAAARRCARRAARRPGEVLDGAGRAAARRARSAARGQPTRPAWRRARSPMHAIRWRRRLGRTGARRRLRERARPRRARGRIYADDARERRGALARICCSGAEVGSGSARLRGRAAERGRRPPSAEATTTRADARKDAWAEAAHPDARGGRAANVVARSSLRAAESSDRGAAAGDDAPADGARAGASRSLMTRAGCPRSPLAARVPSGGERPSSALQRRSVRPPRGDAPGVLVELVRTGRSRAAAAVEGEAATSRGRRLSARRARGWT